MTPSQQRQRLTQIQWLHLLLLVSSNCLTATLFYILTLNPTLGFESAAKTTRTLSLAFLSLCVLGTGAALAILSYQYPLRGVVPTAAEKEPQISRITNTSICRLEPALLKPHISKPLPWILPPTTDSPTLNWVFNTRSTQLEYAPRPGDMPASPVQGFLPGTVYDRVGNDSELGEGNEDSIGHITIMNDTGPFV